MINYLEEPHFAHHHHGGEIEHVKLMAAQYYTSLLSQLTSHKHNTDVHVSNEDREKWDNKADNTSLYELEQQLIDKADKKDIPTLISELQNDVPYLKSSELDDILSQYGYITYTDLGSIDWSRYITGNFVSENELATRLQGYLLISELYNRVHNLGFITEDDISGSSFNGFVKRSELENYIKNTDILFYNNGTAVRKGDYIETGSGGGSVEQQKLFFINVEHDVVPQLPAVSEYSSSQNVFIHGSQVWTHTNTNPGQNQDTYMMWAWFVNNAPQTTSGPVRIYNGGQGGTGSNGEDANEIEWIYRRVASKPTTQVYEQWRESLENAKGANLDRNGNPYTTENAVPVNWEDNPQGISETLKYEYASFRASSINDEGKRVWGRTGFSAPILWSAYGERGVDGDGVEYIFYADADSSPDWLGNDDPRNWTNDADFQNPEYIRGGSSWSDNPIDLSTSTYGPGSVEWVSMRKKQNGIWQAYSAPAVWSRLGKDGVVDGYTVDLSNENMPVGTDAEGNASNYSNSTLVQAFYNGTPLTWEDTVSTPSSGHFTYTTGNITRSDGADPTNIAATSNGATITVAINSTGITNFDEVNAYVPVTITLPNGTTRDARITLFGVATGEAGQAIDLYTSCSVIRTDSGKTIATPSSISIGVKIGRGNNVATYLSGNDAENRGYSFKYAYDNATIDSSTPQHRGAITIDSGNHSSITVEMFKNGVMIDAETIPFVADGNTGASVEAQYAPNNTPTPSQIHNTWQSGDIYMRTKSTTDSDWSPWYRIVGETGGETNYSFGVSAYDTTANVSTSPSDISPSDWSDAPVATTTQKPYLWARVQKKDGNGNNIGNPSYIRLTGEKGEPGSAFVVDIDNQMSQVGIDSDRVVINDFETTTQLRAFYGSQEITNECTFTESHDDSGIYVDVYNSSTATPTNPIGSTRIRVFSENLLSEESSIITYTITHPTYAPNGRTVTFTLLAIAPGADGKSTTYEVLPSETQIRASRDANGNYVPSSANITCGYIKNDGDTITTVTDVNSAFDGYELYFRLHGRSTNTWTAYTKYRNERSMATGFALNLNDKIEYIICTNTANSITESQITGLIDRETVPVVSDGIPGAAGETTPYLELLGTPIWYKAGVGGYAAGTQTFNVGLSLKVGNNTATIASVNDITITNRLATLGVTVNKTSTSQLSVVVAANGAPSSTSGYITVEATGTYGGKTYTARGSITVDPLRRGESGTGKPSRFYYYAGEFNSSNTGTYTCSDTQAPYFKYNDGYWMFKNESETFTGKTVSEIQSLYGAPAENTYWTQMQSDFKYIISEAVFSDNAKLGSAIFSGDWMISQEGIVDDTYYAKNSTVIVPMVAQSGIIDTQITPYTLFTGQGLANGTVHMQTVNGQISYGQGSTGIMSANLEAGSIYKITCQITKDTEYSGDTEYIELQYSGSSATYERSIISVPEEGGTNTYIFTPQKSGVHGFELFRIHNTSETNDDHVTVKLEQIVFKPQYAIDLSTGSAYANKTVGNFISPVLNISADNIDEYLVYDSADTSAYSSRTDIRYINLPAYTSSKFARTINILQVPNAASTTDPSVYVMLPSIATMNTTPLTTDSAGLEMTILNATEDVNMYVISGCDNIYGGDTAHGNAYGTQGRWLINGLGHTDTEPLDARPNYMYSDGDLRRILLQPGKELRLRSVSRTYDNQCGWIALGEPYTTIETA